MVGELILFDTRAYKGGFQGMLVLGFVARKIRHLGRTYFEVIWFKDENKFDVPADGEYDADIVQKWVREARSYLEC